MPYTKEVMTNSSNMKDRDSKIPNAQSFFLSKKEGHGMAWMHIYLERNSFYIA
jgi:hypothetical protein